MWLQNFIRLIIWVTPVLEQDNRNWIFWYLHGQIAHRIMNWKWKKVDFKYHKGAAAVFLNIFLYILCIFWCMLWHKCVILTVGALMELFLTQYCHNNIVRNTKDLKQFYIKLTLSCRGSLEELKFAGPFGLYKYLVTRRLLWTDVLWP